MKKISVITTTINIPLFLNNIVKNIKYHKTQKLFDISIIVVGDKKTPIKAKKFCEDLKKKSKIKISFLDIKFQDRFFKKYYPSFYKLFPYNDAIRKLLGSVYVLNDLPDKVIFIDDDNFANNNLNFIEDFNIVGSSYSGNVVFKNNSWPNVYASFKEQNNIPLYPRGFPWKYRNFSSFNFKTKKVRSKKVVANCGFILNDPDIDAVSRLFLKIKTVGVKNNKYFVISENNFFPLNDQNLCVSKEYVALYYKPLSAGRNSDIWTSYLISKVASYHNELISYGRPHLTQIRNIHDYWNDYDLEKKHNIATDLFADILIKIKLNKNNTRYLNYVKLCNDGIIIAKGMIRKEKSKKLKVRTRHYQNITGRKLSKRNIESLKYIIEYFKEYNIWLKQVKKYSFNKF